MYASEKNAWIIFFCVCFGLAIVIINAMSQFENRYIYFKIQGMDMEFNDIMYNTSLSMTYPADCEDWCNNEPKCQAYVVSNSSFCSLKSFNRGRLVDNASKSVFLRQTPNVDPILGSSFTLVYPNTYVTDNLLTIYVINYLSPIDCMNEF